MHQLFGYYKGTGWQRITSSRDERVILAQLEELRLTIKPYSEAKEGDLLQVAHVYPS